VGAEAVVGIDGEVAAADSLIFIAILARNIILRDFVRVNFSLVGVAGVLHALHCLGLERVSFLEQLVHTLGIRTFNAGQSLQSSRLAARTCCQSLRSI
jgi:hypothetical protein